MAALAAPIAASQALTRARLENISKDTSKDTPVRHADDDYAAWSSMSESYEDFAEPKPATHPTRARTQNRTIASNTSSPRTTAPHTKPIQTAVTSEVISAPTSALTEHWQRLIPQLGLKALARQLALQSELIQLDAELLVLRCEKLSLASSDMALSGLKQAINQHYQQQGIPAPMVRVEVAQAGQIQDSPQQNASRARETAQADARQAIESNPVIARIVHTFDGMILPNSIVSDAP